MLRDDADCLFYLGLNAVLLEERELDLSVELEEDRYMLHCVHSFYTVLDIGQ